MTKKQWTAVLKDGRTAIIRYTNKKDIDELYILYKIFAEELQTIPPTKKGIEESLNIMEHIILVAEVDNKVISVLESIPWGYEGITVGDWVDSLDNDRHLDYKNLQENEFSITESITHPDYRGRGANECLKLVMLRLKKVPKVVMDITSKQGEALVKGYKRIAKETKMDIRVSGESKQAQKKKTFHIELTKSRESNELLEKLLKERYGVEY